MSGGRIGVFGGAFDPPHVGHLIVAQDVFEALRLDRLLVVPSARPPHRAARLPAEVRLALTQDAFADDARMIVSEMELRRPGPSWTVSTLASIRKEWKPDRLWLVIGSDQYRSFDDWREPEKILELAELAVMPRDGAAPARDPRYPFIPVPVTRVDVSSTRVRDRLDAGRDVRYLVPETIRERLIEIWSEGARTAETAVTVAAGLERDTGDGC
ncbi:MAG: nicotinate (nicotinamide) nucleotide adenylyltransferase [Gemmatimonadota bacterium]